MKEPIDVQKITFDDLKRMFEDRIFAIPEIQRDFVWTKTKIVNLLDSINKHYPIGSFLICKVPASQSKNIRESSVLPAYDKKNNDECYVVIDGQQRLSVLYSIMEGMKLTKTSHYQNGINFQDICFSPSQDKESGFGFYDTKRGNYIKLYDVLNHKKLGYLSQGKLKRIEECANAFKNYSFSFVFITGYNEQSMREVFIRLNKGGTSLSSEDKIFTLAYHKDTDFKRHCDQALHDLKAGFDTYERKHLIKSIAVNLGVKDFVNSSSLDNFAKKLRDPKNKYHKDYAKYHKKIFESIKLSSDFLVKRFKHASYIPYPAMLSIISVFFYHNHNRPPNQHQICQIEKWFWITGFTKRYSGSNQRKNQMNDAIEMVNLAKKSNYKINFRDGARIEPLSTRELSKVKYNSPGALKNAYFCYLISKKPMSFENREGIEIGEVSSQFNIKNDHHVFPKSTLIGKIHIDDINSILNICFLTFGENIRIKNKEPWVYLDEYKLDKKFKKIMNSHALPIKESLLKKGDISQKYQTFRNDRMEFIKRDLIDLMGKELVEN